MELLPEEKRKLFISKIGFSLFSAFVGAGAGLALSLFFGAFVLSVTIEGLAEAVTPEIWMCLGTVLGAVIGGIWGWWSE
ncbi:MAG: hypothetical protein JSU92_11840 [Deltaproteobacteria bacterium]|nr:MAG: hypothetical protein JSU92_11840 [Deltaproteobacteria bacterium]